MNVRSATKRVLIQTVRGGIGALGLHLQSRRHDPWHKLLGLENYPIRTVFDIGANRGQFARRMLPHFPDAQFHCFEPQERPYGELASWARSNGRAVHTHQRALGATAGDAVMMQHLDHDTSSSLLATTDHGVRLYPSTQRQSAISVRRETLDGFVASLEHPLADDIFIKMDVQGYEDRVVAGGTATFRRARACLAEICAAPLYEEQATLQGLLHALGELGLRYAGNLSQTMGADGRLIHFDAFFLRTTS
jgi:FkbM family methyltransferase